MCQTWLSNTFQWVVSSIHQHDVFSANTQLRILLATASILVHLIVGVINILVFLGALVHVGMSFDTMFHQTGAPRIAMVHGNLDLVRTANVVELWQ